MQENLSKNTIIQIYIYCNRKTVLDETLKTVPKAPLKQGNNTETFRINCSSRFGVLSTTDNDDDDDDNDSKLGKSENIITEVLYHN